MENTNNTNKTLTTKAAGISLFVAVVLFIIVIFGAQWFLPPYFFNSSTYYFLIILLEMIPLGAGVWVYLVISKQRISDIIVFSRPQAKMNKKYMPWLVLLGAAMAIVGRMFLSGLQLIWMEVLGAIGYSVAEVTFPPIGTPAIFLIALIGIAITPAIFEELIFRGILQKGLLRSAKPRTAIILSSLMFMLMHLSVEAMIFTFVCGLLLGYMAYKSGSIVPSMAFHFINNSIAVFGLYALEMLGKMNVDIDGAADISQYGMSETVTLIIYGIISLALLGLTIWGFAKIAKSPPDNPYLKPMKPISIVLIVLSGCIMFFVMCYLAVLQNIFPM